MNRSFFAVAVAALTGLGGAVAQSAPVPTPRPPAAPAPVAAPFQRVADELRRAGDEALADEVLRAAEKIGHQPAATPRPSPAGRVRRATRNADQVPVASAIPHLGGLFVRQAPVAQAVPVAPVAARVAPPGAPAPVPAPGDGGVVKHYHEVHHYFHGAPPAGVGRLLPGGASGGQAPAPRAGADRAPVARTPRQPGRPTALTQPAPGAGAGARRAQPPSALPNAEPPTPPGAPAAPRLRRAQPVERVAEPVQPTPAEPPQRRMVQPRAGVAPSPQARGGGVGAGPGVTRARSAQPQAGGAPARALRRAPGAGGTEAGGEAKAPSKALGDDVDGLRREVDELRALLQKLREQIRARSPN